MDKFIQDCAGVGEGDKIILVIHDWGSGLGFNWAYNHPDQVKGIAYMESIIQPFSYDDFNEDAQGMFQALKTPGVGEEMILEQNVFIEQILNLRQQSPILRD